MKKAMYIFFGFLLIFFVHSGGKAGYVVCLGEEKIGVIYDAEALKAVRAAAEEEGGPSVRLYPCFSAPSRGKPKETEMAEKPQVSAMQEEVTRAFVPPLSEAYISSPFGERDGAAHKGIDLAAPYGTSIFAAKSGTVSFSGEQEGYGNILILRHADGFETYYAHCEKLFYQEGDEVEAGEIVAQVGSTGRSTGPHLHFEIRKDGLPQNPNDHLDKYYK